MLVDGQKNCFRFHAMHAEDNLVAYEYSNDRVSTISEIHTNERFCQQDEIININSCYQNLSPKSN